MLQDIRDNSQGVVAKVIIGFIVAIFALFGVDSIMSGFTTSPPVAEINGEEITEAQLQIKHAESAEFHWWQRRFPGSGIARANRSVADTRRGVATPVCAEFCDDNVPTIE